MSNAYMIEAIAALMLAPREPADVQEYTGANEQSVRVMLNQLHERGIVHISARNLRGTRWIPTYTLQPRPFEFADVPEPPKSRDPEQLAWRNLKLRNPEVARQFGDFNGFFAALGRRPSTRHLLLRIDLQRPHSRDNLAWIADPDRSNR